jgi:hypothetical protein
MKSDSTLFLYLGHHKCASRSLHNIFQEAMIATGRKHGCITYPHPDILPLVTKHNFECLSVRQADYTKLEDLESFRGFHLIRDPRDIVISAYFSHRYSHPTANWPELEEHRQQLNCVSQEKGIFLDMEFGVTKDTLIALQNWNYNDQKILELKFEHFINDPIETFLDIFSFFSLLEKEYSKRFLSLFARYLFIRFNQYIYSYKLSRILRPLRKKMADIRPEELRQIVEKYSFEKLSGGRHVGELDPKKHYRKGVSNDWKNHFTDNHKKYFKEKYQDLLEKTGYEQDKNW